ncbi:restriction endonuclease subunit S [Thermodesulfovibrio thiophilus]|uniref:restriction endonuclease subunit S n=1 Tax=Thermodesulfovibrio thiophilus TaxID=340095 RepID=UPI00048C4D74|nr:restriction endonuclease subunit S [Thermodesulfovibrio thiophilus]
MNATLKLPEGWKFVKLEEVTEILDSKRIPLDSEFRKNIQGSFPYCGATGIIDYIDNWIFDGEYVLVAEDGGKFFRFETTAYLMKGKFWANNHVHIMKGKSEFLNNEFLSYFINFEDISSYISGSTREKLNQKLLRNIVIPLPPLPEQQKIAEILETVDNCLEKTQQLIEKYKRIKQGLMEELLTKGIDENGNIRSEETHRFKDSPLGRIPEEWEVVRLENEVYLNPDTLKYEKNKTIFYIDIESIIEGQITSIKIYKTENAPSRARRLVKTQDIIVSTVRPNLKAFAYIKPKYNEYICSTGFAVLRAKNRLFSEFLFCLVLYDDIFLKQISKFITGSNYPAVNPSELLKIIIPLPPLSEQQRIAEILSQIDEVIEKEEKYKEKLERLKKGLMEDLLSGKIRVNHFISEEKELQDEKN